MRPPWAFITLASIAAGALVANLYYAQPLISSIAPELGISPALAGSAVSVTQIGYGLGLFFLVSLADLIENRKLVLITVVVTTLGLLAAATSHSALQFFIASLIVGICSAGAQVLVPFVAHLVPEAQRGRIIGNVMAGLLTGIMLARPASLFISASFGWRAVFFTSALLMVVIGAALARMMPQRAPNSGLTYGRILATTVSLLREFPPLRWRAAYHFLMFGAFSIFWTVAPIMLAQHFGMSERAIALFALAGAGGALAAPLAGYLADRGFIRLTTAAAMAILAVTCYGTQWAVAASSIASLAILTVLFDGAVQTNQVVSQRVIFSVPATLRGRANAMYMSIVFLGGAAGSLFGTLAYDRGNWPATALLGGTVGVVAIALLGVENALGRLRPAFEAAEL
jgi:predicted MFS family arabinose efflux permease